MDVSLLGCLVAIGKFFMELEDSSNILNVSMQIFITTQIIHILTTNDSKD